MADEIVNGYRDGVFYGHAFYDQLSDEMLTFQQSIEAYKKYLAGELHGEKGDTGAAGAQGIQGIEGPAGPIGPAGLTWKGQWAVGTSYTPDSAVGFEGASYFALRENTGKSPSSSPEDWALLASQGVRGPQGLQGVAGPAGTQGIQGVKGDTGATGAAAKVNTSHKVYQGLINQTDVLDITLPGSLRNIKLSLTGTKNSTVAAGLLWIGVKNLSGAAVSVDLSGSVVDYKDSTKDDRFSTSVSVNNNSSTWNTKFRVGSPRTASVHYISYNNGLNSECFRITLYGQVASTDTTQGLFSVEIVNMARDPA